MFITWHTDISINFIQGICLGMLGQYSEMMFGHVAHLVVSDQYLEH